MHLRLARRNTNFSKLMPEHLPGFCSNTNGCVVTTWNLRNEDGSLAGAIDWQSVHDAKWPRRPDGYDAAQGPPLPPGNPALHGVVPQIKKLAPVLVWPSDSNRIWSELLPGRVNRVLPLFPRQVLCCFIVAPKPQSSTHFGFPRMF